MSNVIIRKGDLKSAEIKISGYKHATVSLIALSVIYNSDYKFYNVPDIEDTRILVKILNYIGKKTEYKNNILEISKSDINRREIPDEYSERIHGSLYLIPAILGINHEVAVCKSGGCRIGDSSTTSTRPLNHMLKVMRIFGAIFENKDEKIVGKVDTYKAASIDIQDFSIKDDELTGPYISGATKTALICAMAVKEGITYIYNPYLKPDVTEMLEVMRKIGFDIKASRKCIIIKPPSVISNKLIEHYVISDMTEIITYISLSIYCDIPLTLSSVTVDRARQALSPELDYLKKMNIQLQWLDNEIKVPINKNIKATDIEVLSTSIYSDSQPFFALILLKAKSKSIIREFVWKNRFSYALEMNKLGTNLVVEDNTLTINPSLPYKDGEVTAKDLRAAAVLIIFALKTESYVKVQEIDHLYRGYVNFLENLRNIGANIELCDD